MLPKHLFGPKRVVYLNKEFAEKFINDNANKYPGLDRCFISQICFEHPDRFDQLFPEFNPEIHMANRRLVTMQWVYDNIRHDFNLKVDNWYDHVDCRLEEKNPKAYHILKHIRENKSWPFPPVIISAEFAILLGFNKKRVGNPYYLVEGTHRVSYANRMFELNEIRSNTEMEIIEIQKIER